MHFRIKLLLFNDFPSYIHIYRVFQGDSAILQENIRWVTLHQNKQAYSHSKSFRDNGERCFKERESVYIY